MKFRSIRLSWFRGAAKEATLPLDGHSALVYGPNGAGKSSFVDGVEAILKGGKLAHLTHEYAGRHQEKGIINTARPSGTVSSVEIVLADASIEAWTWSKGAAVRSSSAPHFGRWDCSRTALRQEELSDFIRATKGAKYNAVVPLLGLSSMEAMAENLHKLSRTIERSVDFAKLRSKIERVDDRRAEVFSGLSNDQLKARIDHLSELYGSKLDSKSRLSKVLDTLTVIEAKILSLDGDGRAAAAIGSIGSSKMATLLDKAKLSSGELTDASESLIKQRLDVLNAAQSYVLVAPLGAMMTCPACGTDVDTLNFKDHISEELAQLSAITQLYNVHGAAVEEICDEVVRLRDTVARGCLDGWRTTLSPEAELGLSYLTSLKIGERRKSCHAIEIAEIENKLLPLIGTACAVAISLTPQVAQLFAHKNRSRNINSCP